MPAHPRYVKQRDESRCGPVAILNALRWAGDRTSYEKAIPHLTTLCNWGPEQGTGARDFDFAIREAGRGLLKVRRVWRPTLAEMEDHLQGGHALVLEYRWKNEKKGQDYRHVCLIVRMSRSGKSFYVVNEFKKRSALSRVTRKTFKKDNLRFARVDPYSIAWFLTKK